VAVPRRSVILLGSAGALVLAGALAYALVGGTIGDAAGFWLIGVGLVLAVSSVFLQVGIGEDRERAREEQARAREAERAERERRRRLGFTRRRDRGA
jgi:UDP-N-acetylmuramyl pentapeptide phosphotransferase/UDP-N-acetylglucosamine-1-phosphate transferase